jgi:uncharacterized protein YecA (UPF0149 family)
MPLSEHDEAERADEEELAAKFAQRLHDLQESGSALGQIPTSVDRDEFTIRYVLTQLHGILYAGGPDYDQVRRVLGLP